MTGMAQIEYLCKVKKEIADWEKQGPGFWSGVTNIVFKPAQKIAETLIPDAVIKTVQKAIEGCLNGLLWGADYTFSDDSVIAEVAKYNSELNNLQRIACSDDLQSMDKASDHYWNQNLVAAIAEGGLTGAGGLAGLAANIPALYTIVFRCIQQIALCYGFDTSMDEEKTYMLGILSIASASDMKSKQAAMIFMRQIQVDIAKKTWKKLAEAGGRHAIGPLVREAAKTIGINLTKRKALQLIPVVGAVIGASFDGSYLQDIAKTAKNCYRKRRLETLPLVC